MVEEEDEKLLHGGAARIIWQRFPPNLMMKR
jgi:hypothetical protein